MHIMQDIGIYECTAFRLEKTDYNLIEINVCGTIKHAKCFINIFGTIILCSGKCF